MIAALLFLIEANSQIPSQAAWYRCAAQETPIFIKAKETADVVTDAIIGGCHSIETDLASDAREAFSKVPGTEDEHEAMVKEAVAVFLHTAREAILSTVVRIRASQ